MALTGTGGNDIDVSVGGDASGLKSALAAGIQSLGNFRSAAMAAGAVVGAVVAKGIKEAVDAAASFEEAMIEVEKVTDPETAAEMGDRIRDMAEEMPVAQEELAGITEQAARLGIEGSKNLEEYTKTAAMMATATDLTADEAADSFARISKLMGIPIEQSGNLGSAMNELANTMGTSSSEITSVMTRAGGALNQLGVGENQALALAGAMNEVSPTARLAAGSMRRMATAMMDPRKVEVFAEALGVTEEEFKNMREEDPSGTLLAVADKANESQEAAETLQVGLGKAGQEFAKLGSNTDSARSATERATKAWEENTGLAEEAAAASSTFSSQVQMLKNRFRNMAIEVGDRLLPYLKEFLSAVNTGLDVLIALNQRLDGALVAGAVGTALSVLAVAAWAAVPALWAMVAPVVSLAAPFLAAGAAIGVLWYAVQNNILGLGDLFDSVMSSVRSAVDIGIRAVERLVDIVKMLLAGDFAGAWQGIKDLVRDGVLGAVEWLKSSAVPALKSAITTLVTNSITAFVVFAEKAPQMVADGINAVTTYLEEDAVDDITAGVQALVTAALDALRGLKSDGPGVMRESIAAMKEWLQSVGVEDLKGAFVTLAEGVVTVLKAWFGLNKAIGGVIVGLIAALVEWLATSAGPQIYEAFKGLALQAYNALAGLKDDLVTRVTEGITAVYEYLTSIGARDIGAAIREIGLAIVAAATKIFEVGGDLYSVIEAGHQAIVDYLREDAKADIKAAFQAIIDSIIETALGLWGAGGELVTLIKNGIASVVEYFRNDAKADAKSGFQAINTAIVEAAKELWGDAGELKTLIVDTIVGIGSYLKNDAKDDLAAAIRAVFDAMYDVAHEFYLGLIGASLIPEMFQEIAAYIAGKAKDLVTNAVQGLVDAWMNIFDVFTVDTLKWLAGLVTDFLAAVNGLRTDAVQEVQTLASDAYQNLTNFGSDVLSWLSGMASDFVSDVSSLASDVVDEFKQMGDDALSKLTSIDFKGAGKQIINDVKDGIKSATPDVGSAVEDAAQTVRDKWPFSPAKEGPLADIDEAGPSMVHEVAEGVTDNLRALESAAESAAAAAHPDIDTPKIEYQTTLPQRAAAAAQRVINNHYAFNIEVVIEGDADEDDVYRAFSSALQSYGLDS